MSHILNVNYENKHCYNIYIENSFDNFSHALSNDIVKNYNKICIVTDSNVAELYLNIFSDTINNLGSSIISFVFEAGEASKNMVTVEKLYQELINHHFDRGDLLIALGGGVVGDLCGFAAATYMRGIDFIQIPTTLLSQVDSSIGGKTGVDFLSYKNMIGAFYMPKMVYINISTLDSLPDYQFSCGMGEVIKHGLIRDNDYYYWLRYNQTQILDKNPAVLEELVLRSCKIKKDTVEIDPKEQGIRAHLNFGHTLGHAIEKLSDFSLGHGQCVSLGMVAAAYLSYKSSCISLNEYDEIIDTLKIFNLPVSINNLSIDAIISASKSDKKMIGSKVKFIYLKEVGEADISLDYSGDDFKNALEQVVIS